MPWGKATKPHQPKTGRKREGKMPLKIDVHSLDEVRGMIRAAGEDGLPAKQLIDFPPFGAHGLSPGSMSSPIVVTLDGSETLKVLICGGRIVKANKWGEGDCQ